MERKENEKFFLKRIVELYAFLINTISPLEPEFYGV